MKTVVYTLILLLLTICDAGAQSGNMETWRNYTSSPLALALEAPVGWYGSDSAVTAAGYLKNPAGTFRKQVFRSTASHGGSYAAMLMTRHMSWYNGTPLPYAAVLSNARMTADTSQPPYNAGFLQLRGGTPVSQRIASVSFWVMQDSVHPDKFMLQAMAVKAGQGAGGKDSVVGDTLTSMYFSTNPGYNLITLPIPYKNGTVVPDHIIVAVYSGSYYVATPPFDSATLYVDDIALNAASGISWSILKEPAIRCIHHRAGSYVEVFSPEARPLQLEVLDVAGRRLGARPFTGNARMDLPSGSPEGLLFYRIKDAAGQAVQQGKFTLAE